MPVSSDSSVAVIEQSHVKKKYYYANEMKIDAVMKQRNSQIRSECRWRSMYGMAPSLFLRNTKSALA